MQDLDIIKFAFAKVTKKTSPSGKKKTFKIMSFGSKNDLVFYNIMMQFCAMTRSFCFRKRNILLS